MRHRRTIGKIPIFLTLISTLIVYFVVFQLVRQASIRTYTTPASDLPHEICREPRFNPGSTSQNLQAPTPVPPGESAIFMAGDITALQSETYTPDDIGSRDPDGTFRILLIPVGYSEGTDIDAHFQPIVTQAEEIWRQAGVDVRYAYLRRSLAVPIYQYRSYLDARNPDPAIGYGQTDELIWNRLSHEGIYTFHVMSLYLNASANLSSTASSDGGLYQTIVGENDWNLYALIHETAHNLGLSDGYEKLYDYEVIAGGSNSELFLSLDSLSPERQQLLKDTGTVIARRDLVCNGQSILSPSGSAESIMTSFFYNHTLVIEGELNPQTFTPYQIELMRHFVEAKLAAAP